MATTEPYGIEIKIFTTCFFIVLLIKMMGIYTDINIALYQVTTNRSITKTGRATTTSKASALKLVQPTLTC